MLDGLINLMTVLDCLLSYFSPTCQGSLVEVVTESINVSSTSPVAWLTVVIDGLRCKISSNALLRLNWLIN